MNDSPSTPEFPNGELQSSHADDVFRYLASLASMFTGDDQTIGWTVSEINVSRMDLVAAVASTGNPWASEERNVGRGWYLIYVNSDGIVRAYRYDTLEYCSKDFLEAAELYDEFAAGVEF